MEEKIKKIIEKQTKSNLKRGELPIAAVVVKNNKIISIAKNKKNITNNPLDHAEIIAIKKAAKKLKSWNLSDCDLYVNLEPCLMCYGVIKEARIKNVYYYLESSKFAYHKFTSKKDKTFIKIDTKENSHKYLKKLFENRRKHSKML